MKRLIGFAATIVVVGALAGLALLNEEAKAKSAPRPKTLLPFTPKMNGREQMGAVTIRFPEEPTLIVIYPATDHPEMLAVNQHDHGDVSVAIESPIEPVAKLLVDPKKDSRMRFALVKGSPNGDGLLTADVIIMRGSDAVKCRAFWGIPEDGIEGIIVRCPPTKK